MLISHICSSVASLGVALRSKAAVAAMAKKRVKVKKPVAIRRREGAAMACPRLNDAAMATTQSCHGTCRHCNGAACFVLRTGGAGSRETGTDNQRESGAIDECVEFRRLATCSFCKIEWWTRAHRQTIMCQRCGAGPLCMECRLYGFGHHIDAQQCGSFCPTCVHRMKDGDGAGVAQGGACRRKKRKTCGPPAAPR